MTLRRELLLALVLSLTSFATVASTSYGSYDRALNYLNSVRQQQQQQDQLYSPRGPAHADSNPFAGGSRQRGPTYVDSSPVDTSLCHATELNNLTIPYNPLSLDHFQVIGVATFPEDCFIQCCSLGPSGCQYIWIFGNICFAVACTAEGASNCQPKTTDGLGLNSYYLTMTYSESSNEGPLDGLESDLDTAMSPSLLVADAGSERLIRLPTNEIFLFGNESHGIKEIVSYKWEMTSTHYIPPILLDADTAVLHAVNLQKGDYTFQLTVTDSAGHTSSDSTAVHVIDTGSTPSNPVPMDGPSSPLPATSSSDPTPPPPPSSSSSNTSTSETATPETGEEEEEEEGHNAGSDGDVESEGEKGAEDGYSRKRNMIRIVVPVLLTVAFILIVSASVVGVVACVCERNRRKMKMHYKYKRLPGTVEKI